MARQREYAEVARQVLLPHLDNPSTTWRGFYQLLLWFAHGVPHIMDANYLKKGAWRRRAEAVFAALSDEFECAPEEVPSRIDRLVKSPIFDEPPQRQNPLGIGLVTALDVALRHFSSNDYRFLPEEAIGKSVFTGVKDAPRLKTDLVVVKGGTEIAIISGKWSLRNDRLKDLRDECSYFKTLRGSLKFYVVTNEFGPARLSKVIEDYCIDAVFHVNRRMVVDVAKVDGRLEPLRDLSELLQLFAK